MSRRVTLSELSPLIEEAMQIGQEVIFTVTGNSMAPMLHHRRDKVCLVKPQNRSLKKYDIPLYVRMDGKYILHRIVGIKNGNYVTLGDNQSHKEYPVSPSQVLGVVKGFWRGGTYHSCESIGYRLYCRIWNFGYPIRWTVMKVKKLCPKLGIT